MPRDHRIVRYRGKLAVNFIDEAGQRRRVSAGTSDRGEAERFLTELIRIQTSSKPALSYTVDQVFEAYRITLGARPAAATARHEWKALRLTFGGIKAASLLNVDPDTRETEGERLCRAHIAARRAAKRKDGTILTELTRLRTALNWGAERGMLEKAPPLAMPPKPRPRARHLTREQFEEFLSACTMPHVRLFTVLAISTGGRMGAILDLTWDRVDFDAGLIHLDDPEKARTRKGRATVPMNRSARAALQEARQGALTGHVIEWAGQRVASVKKGIREAGKRVGMIVSPHDFRHSAAVWMAQGGASMKQIADFLGHEDSRLTERVYAKFRPDFLRDVAAHLEIGVFARKAG